MYVVKPNDVFIHLEKCIFFNGKAREAYKKSTQFPYFGLDLSIFVKMFEIYLVTEAF
jgi:hypothetical protein